MGYFITGYTNKSFRIRKENFKPAFKALCQLNANDSLKGGFGQQSYTSAQLKHTFASNPNRCFGWVNWNFDNRCHNLIDVLRGFGFFDKYSWSWDKKKNKAVRGTLQRRGLTFNKHGDLTGMFYNTKNGDINYILDTIAPYVDKYGKMFWTGEDGQKYTTNFDKTRPFNPSQLNAIRKDLVKLLQTQATCLHYINASKYPFTAKDNPIELIVKKLTIKLGKYAVMCGGQLSHQTRVTGVDMASMPFNIMLNLLHDDMDNANSLIEDNMPVHFYPNNDLANEDCNSAMHLSSFTISHSRLFTKYNYHVQSLVMRLENTERKIGLKASQSKDLHYALTSPHSTRRGLHIIIGVMQIALLVLKAQKFNTSVPAYNPISKDDVSIDND